MGSFLALNTGPVPGPSKVLPTKVKKQIKQIEEPAKHHDIRDIFKAGCQGKGNNTDTKAVIEIDQTHYILQDITIFPTKKIKKKKGRRFS